MIIVILLEFFVKNYKVDEILFKYELFHSQS